MNLSAIMSCTGQGCASFALPIEPGWNIGSCMRPNTKLFVANTHSNLHLSLLANSMILSSSSIPSALALAASVDQSARILSAHSRCVRFSAINSASDFPFPIGGRIWSFGTIFSVV